MFKNQIIKLVTNGANKEANESANKEVTNLQMYLFQRKII